MWDVGGRGRARPRGRETEGGARRRRVRGGRDGDVRVEVRCDAMRCGAVRWVETDDVGETMDRRWARDGRMCAVVGTMTRDDDDDDD